LYGGGGNQMNLLRSAELAALARGMGRVRMASAGAPGVGTRWTEVRAAHSDLIFVCAGAASGGSK